MAPGIMSPALANINGNGPLSPGLRPGFRRISGHMDNDNVSIAGMSQMGHSRRVSRRFQSVEATATSITNVVSSLKRRSGDELGTTASSRLLNATHASLVDWIRTQRMTHLPPEGSDYDKVLSWAQLFVERMNLFDLAIEGFAGDSYLAAQLVYGYCAMLLELGKENAHALVLTFGFFYSTSMVLLNLLERAELFNVSQEIREHLVLALGDLVTLVASVSTYFHRAIRGLTKGSISVNIYVTFPGQIQAFHQRCEKITESMWRHQFQKENVDSDKVFEIKSIRSWLGPDDPVLRNAAESTSYLAQSREELTCLWLGPHLASFLRSSYKSLCVTGKPGSGKTVLASVVVDQLQHPIGGVSYNTLFVPINGRIRAESSPRVAVKMILRQLLDKRIGNVQLFRILADAFEQSKLETNDVNYDNILWTALERALSAALHGAKELVIVVDGVDEASGGEGPLLQKLNDVTSKGSNVKLITFATQALQETIDQKHIRISEDLIFDDIAAVVRGVLGKSEAFSSLFDIEQETMVDRITSASGSSFLWAELIAQYVRHESSAESLRRAVDMMLDAKPTTTDIVLRYLQLAGVTTETKLMLLWLATVDRPLQVKELATLMSIQVDRQTVTDDHIDPLHTLEPLGSLILVQDGHISLRHLLIRTAVLDLLARGNLMPTIKDHHHADLVIRLLIYIKTTVTEQHETSLTSLEQHDTDRLLNKYPLLDFAIRYWTLHFRQTSVFLQNGVAHAAKEITNVFPTSTTIPLLESAVWERIPTPELLSYQTIVTNVAQEILPPNSAVTLQYIIYLAQFYRRVDRITDAIPLFHQAATVSRTLLTVRHVVTMQMATIFLELTVGKITDSKTDIMTNREEILLLLVDCYKVHYGDTSENVLTIYHQLVEHYRFLKDEQNAQAIIVLIQTITTTHHETDSHRVSGDLSIQLVRNERRPIETGFGLSLEITEEDEIISESYDIEALIQLALNYVGEGQIDLAEAIYLEIWDRASKEFRLHYSALMEERKIKAIIAYSKFLRIQMRLEEASSILSSFWQEYERSTFSESSVSYFLEIAKVMKTVGLSTLALAVYKHCSEFYQGVDRTETTTYKEILDSIQTTSTELMQAVSALSSSSVTVETTLEEVVMEASTSITTVNNESFAATEKLISLYISQNRRKDAIRLSKQVLHGIWPSLFAPSLQDVTLPSEHLENCVELAKRLAYCYSTRSRLTKEQDIRIRIYRAVRSGRDVEDQLRRQITTELLEFLEGVSEIDMLINIHQELLNDYIKHYGPEHAVVIKTLWTLAQVTRPRPIFVDYYLQIVQILNKTSPTSHPEAFEALVIVATEIWNQGRYPDALHHYEVLFTTFLKEPKQHPKLQDQDFVKEVFNRYTHCLRTTRTEFKVLHSVTLEYQSHVKEIFGVTASITIQATWTLAKLCQESKHFEMEAIALYEELLKIESEEVDVQKITDILDSIYEEQAAVVFSSADDTSISSSQVEKAVKVLRKRITTVRETHGWAHEESLSKMKEIVILLARKKEIDTVTKELQETTVHILSSETTGLTAAAITIASSYIETGQKHKAIELADEIYLQIVAKDNTNIEKFGFDLTSQGRQSLIFLAQLEHSLRQHTSSVTEILASLTAEYSYVEEITKLVKTETTTLHAVSVSTARLYHHLLATKRHAVATLVFTSFTSYFLTSEGERVGLTEASEVKVFLQTILDHLSAHRSEDFIRTIGIISNTYVAKLVSAGQYDDACNLALASFKYITAQDAYRTPAIVRFVFALSIAVSGRNAASQHEINDTIRKKLLSVSETILRHSLSVIKELAIDLTLVDIEHLNTVIGLLGEQEDYKNLSWLLTILWNSRESQSTWQPYISFALGRRLIMAKYLVGDALAALRLAENIVYNYRQVYGTCHTNTLEMSVLLSQLYTGVAQRYQSDKNGWDLAARYYKKASALHENILRSFTDSSSSTSSLLPELDAVNGDGSLAGSVFEIDLRGENGTTAIPISNRQHAIRHLGLLRLAIQRLGGWPKDYSEYKRLGEDLMRALAVEEVSEVEMIETWNVKGFGGGKAQSDEDQVDRGFKAWRIFG
ncbi:hypothetical protein FQN50_007620 [Emmonsiellopsis sp. PD_5]|nr:hypothetical protein FQN50_007620 [Emmonsiellopsis sp. PD_5]